MAVVKSTLLDVVGLHETMDFIGMTPTDDDVVVADGVLQQIRLQVHVERDLCAAEMVAVGRFDGFGLCHEIPVQLRTTPFK